MFISYLWGIETVQFAVVLVGAWRFISYLWGIETFISTFSHWQSSSLYLTYEELKPIWATYNISIIIVYILPMRNWNGSAPDRSGWWFICLYLTYEELKLLSSVYFYLLFCYPVYILPMRNWNTVSSFEINSS